MLILRPACLVLVCLTFTLNVAKSQEKALSPFKEAIALNDIELVKKLVEDKEFKVNKLEDGSFPLMDAVIANRPEVVQILLDKGAQVNLALPDGITSLAHAVQWGNGKIVRILLENGANPNQKQKGISVLAIARLQENKVIMSLLKKYGAKD